MFHNNSTMENFGKPVIVKGQIQYYKNKKRKLHGITMSGKPKKIRKDKKSPEPTKTPDR